MSLTTSVCVVLAILHRSTATAIMGVPADKPASGSPLYTNISDVILLSLNEPWKEAHSTLARWIRRPITTWSVQNKPFIHNYITAVNGSRKPVFFIVDTRKKSSTREMIRVMCFTCSPAYLLLIKPDIHELLANTYMKPPGLEIEAVYLTLNETSMQSFSWPQESSGDQKPRSISTFGKLSHLNRYSPQSLGGCTLRVTCVSIEGNEGTADTCNDTSVNEILAFLNRRNVTVELVEASDPLQLSAGLIFNISDVGISTVPLGNGFSFLFDFPAVRIAHDTFYSRVDPHRVVSLLEVAGESFNFVAATAVLLALVVLVSAVIGDKRWSFFEDVSDTALFLLAAVLGTSAVEPNIRGRAGIARKSLLGLWIVSLLPLSVYFRTELTALVTLKRPAYRIDTLQKLEDALDTRQVAPCVVKYTLSYTQLQSPDLPRQSLFNKLQLEFKRHGKELVTNNVPDCLQCASRRDRVCYIGRWRHPSSSLLKRKSVGEVAEHLKIELAGFLMRKSHPLYRPFRRFFLDIEEHKLIHLDAREPEYETGEAEFDMSGLLMLLVILHATSCLVLVLELAVARYVRRARFCQVDEGCCLSSVFHRR